MSRLRYYWINWTDLLAMRLVKTTISIPDDLFAQANALAARLQISQSELYAIAVEEYVAKHRDGDIVARLNAVYSDLSSGVDPALRRAQAKSLAAAW